jgi:imidazolonepropionase-like amidohydrolase
MENETNPNEYLEKYQSNEADLAFKSAMFSKVTLMAGFTTVRDVGGTGVNISLRDAIEKGYVVGPRVFTAGKSLATTGGHADPTNGGNNKYIGDPGPKDGVVNGVADAKKAVRQRYKNGANLIKITATGGVLSQAKNSSNPQFTIEEIKAITETAADYGFHVAAHAHGDDGMQRAILGGVKTIEHGTKMSDKTMKMMVDNDVYLDPTIIAGKFVTEKAQVENYYPEVVRPKALEIGPKIQDTFRKAYKMGVPIVFGTDAGVFPHGENWKEFGYMIEVGMPVNEAIQSATLVPAKILKKENELGQLKKDF